VKILLIYTYFLLLLLVVFCVLFIFIFEEVANELLPVARTARLYYQQLLGWCAEWSWGGMVLVLG